MTLARPSLFLGNETVRTESISPQVAAEVDAEIRRLIEQGGARALEILGTRRQDLERLSQLLLERETLERTELEAALASDSDAPEKGAVPIRKPAGTPSLAAR